MTGLVNFFERPLQLCDPRIPERKFSGDVALFVQPFCRHGVDVCGVKPRLSINGDDVPLGVPRNLSHWWSPVRPHRGFPATAAAGTPRMHRRDSVPAITHTTACSSIHLLALGGEEGFQAANQFL